MDLIRRAHLVLIAQRGHECHEIVVLAAQTAACYVHDASYTILDCSERSVSHFLPSSGGS